MFQSEVSSRGEGMTSSSKLSLTIGEKLLDASICLQTLIAYISLLIKHSFKIFCDENTFFSCDKNFKYFITNCNETSSVHYSYQYMIFFIFKSHRIPKTQNILMQTTI